MPQKATDNAPGFADVPWSQQMGVSLLWFMPIQPSGLKSRKGGLGSYYAIRDYTAVNPKFGTLADFRRVVEKAHPRPLT